MDMLTEIKAAEEKAESVKADALSRTSQEEAQKLASQWLEKAKADAAEALEQAKAKAAAISADARAEAEEEKQALSDRADRNRAQTVQCILAMLKA